MLLTPRSLWHECDHSSHFKSHLKKELPGKTKIENKCFACDFDIDCIDKPGSILSFYFPKSYPNPLLDCAYSVQKAEFNPFSQRGPPVL